MRKIEKKTENISVRLPKSGKAALEKMAEENDRSISWVVAKIIEKHLKAQGTKIE